MKFALYFGNQRLYARRNLLRARERDMIKAVTDAGYEYIVNG